MDSSPSLTSNNASYRCLPAQGQLSPSISTATFLLGPPQHWPHSFNVPQSTWAFPFPTYKCPIACGVKKEMGGLINWVLPHAMWRMFYTHTTFKYRTDFIWQSSSRHGSCLLSTSSSTSPPCKAFIPVEFHFLSQTHGLTLCWLLLLPPLTVLIAASQDLTQMLPAP